MVVLANSLGTASGMWAAQLEPFTRHRRVVRFEHRGHGGSLTPKGPYSIADLGHDVVDLLDHLDVERASVCGVSLGGMVAMARSSASTSSMRVSAWSSANSGTPRRRPSKKWPAISSSPRLERLTTVGRDASPIR